MKFFKEHKNKINMKDGFTLVETLIAIAIFTTSILALMSVLSQGISSTNYAKRKMIASYLAQEGIEQMRNLRDTYVLYAGSSQTGWDSFSSRVTSACTVNGTCYMNTDNLNYASASQPMISATVTACNGAPCTPLNYDSATGKYSYQGATSSGYTRTMTATAVSVNEIKITSKVSWIQGSGPYSITFSESLYNWID